MGWVHNKSGTRAKPGSLHTACKVLRSIQHIPKGSFTRPMLCADTMTLKIVSVELKCVHFFIRGAIRESSSLSLGNGTWIGITQQDNY